MNEPRYTIRIQIVEADEYGKEADIADFAMHDETSTNLGEIQQVVTKLAMVIDHEFSENMTQSQIADL